MTTLGKLTNSFFSATNENTLALANFNFDFSLMRFDAPKEFHKLGATLTQQRRDEAEEGATHKTARRLGALFEALVPSITSLIKAYGTRASDIATLPKVNPKGSRNDGPFEAYVGADGTSLWAAATSQQSDAKAHAPLALHLLACMLARAFKADEAISIWAELVHSRQQEILSKVDSEAVPISTCMAARQDITREHLALWDASARSWLRTADEAKRVQRTQLQLIVDNLHLNFLSSKSTYESVIDVWQQATMGMEKCINGTPQEVSDGSILLALSSWHLYPDLILPHEATTRVSFNDPLLRKGGAITVGLEFAPGSRPAGMHWSLTLSHLRYYGDAVKVISNSDVQRVTLKQLLLMVFGNLLSSWDIPRNTTKEVFCAEWVLALSETIRGRNDTGQPKPGDWCAWVRLLAEAADTFLELVTNDPNTCSMLVGWGRRRCKTFLGSTKLAPFFGFDKPAITLALKEPEPLECGIQFLRALAANAGLDSGDAVIRYAVKVQRSVRLEFATAIPHIRSDLKRSFDGTLKQQRAHCRWVGINVDMSQDVAYYGCLCESCDESCQCSLQLGRCGPNCHNAEGGSRDCRSVGPWPSLRYQHISTKLREDCGILHIQQTRDLDVKTLDFNNVRAHATNIRDFEGMESMGGFVWQWPPHTFHNHEAPNQPPPDCPSLSVSPERCQCFSLCHQKSEYYHDANFRLVHGTMSGLGLFVRVRPEAHDVQSRYDACYSKVKDAFESKMEPQSTLQLLYEGANSTATLLNLMKHIARTNTGSKGAASGRFDVSFTQIADLMGIDALPSPYLRSLTLLSYAHNVYKPLSGATIPTDILSTPLHQAEWLSHNWSQSAASAPTSTSLPTSEALFADVFGKSTHTSSSSQLIYANRSMTRSETFACIAMFESGVYNIDGSTCKPVIAVASANSLFIAAELLTDPTSQARNSVRRVVGNVGRPGISMLVLPQHIPRVRPLSNDWRAVTHQLFDHAREDNFQGTTLVLSFTEWKRPLQVVQRGSIDEDINFIECVVSVHDRGSWVADLTPMDMEFCTAMPKCCCNSISQSLDQDVTSIDSWEELLDAPENLAIFRAKGNWVARLGAIAIRRQKGEGKKTCVVSGETDFCVHCVASAFRSHHGSDLGGVIID